MMSDCPSYLELYVALNGNDQWSGRFPDPNADRTDGPFATITGARDAVRRLKQEAKLSGAITVWVRGGRYELAAPLVFGPEDSAPVTYAAYPGEEPILSGGRKIEGWREETANGVRAWVTEVPEARAAGLSSETLFVDDQPLSGPGHPSKTWYFRSLFVNGRRAVRPRQPKDGFYRVKDFPGSEGREGPWGGIFSGGNAFQCEPGHVKSWKNVTDVDVVLFHWWIEERLPIASFDEKTNTVKSTHTTRMTFRDDVAKGYARYYVENVFEALSEPGEWYLDRTSGKLYYVPMPGERVKTAEVYAPRIEQVLRLVGKPDESQFVEFLRFEGLIFEHTEWKNLGEWSVETPDAIKQKPALHASSGQAAQRVPGVVYLEGARSCAIEDCTIRHIGGYGIELGDGCTGNRIVGNTIQDLGAGGVKLNGSRVDEPVARRTGNNRVTDNVIEHGGHVFMSAVGILSMHSFGNVLAHNHIHDLYYTGISCGWVWGYADNVSRNNHIEKNHIHDLGHGLLSDMGGIYTLGVQPGTVLRGNLIHDVEKANYGGWAIYPDEGSSHLIIQDNVCYNTSSAVFHQHYGRENTVRNNIFAFGREGVATVTRLEPHLSFTFERNILISDDLPVFAGGRVETPVFISDINLMWDISGKPVVNGNQGRDEEGRWVLAKAYSFEEWQKLGYDLHSIVADPKCRDPRTFDFTLAQDSPALKLGFKPIDLSDVGPRPKEKRE